MARDFVDSKLFETGEAADPAPRVPAGTSKTFRGYDPVGCQYSIRRLTRHDRNERQSGGTAGTKA